MKELSLHILDVASNSISAGATTVIIDVIYDFPADLLTIKIVDDGCGMTEEMLSRVTDPFTTTRTTRKVGLGLPLFKQSAEMAGGQFTIQSQRQVGTTVQATYVISNVDRMPLGDLADSICGLIQMKGSVHFILNYAVDEKSFVFDTDEVKHILGEVSITENEVLEFLKQYINEGIFTTNGGREVI